MAGILWHQGESDSQDGKNKDYYPKIQEIFQELRRELSASNIPVVIGGLGDYLGKDAFGASCIEYRRINEELQKYAQDNENCYYVTAKGLTANPDGIHINAMSQRIFCIRYYEAYHKKENIFEPLTNEKDLVDGCHNRINTPVEKTYMALEKFALGKSSYEELMKSLISGGYHMVDRRLLPGNKRKSRVSKKRRLCCSRNGMFRACGMCSF